jgi:carboxylesterase type B
MLAAGALFAAIQEPPRVEGGRSWTVAFSRAPTAWTGLDRKPAVMLSTYWSNFAKTGDPNGAGLPQWPTYNPNDEQLLNIGDELREESQP